MAGKVSRATELSTNTVPSEMAICSSLAPVMGPTAAMALPPQMAVPVEIRKAGVRCILEHRTQRHADHHSEADAEDGVNEPAASSTDHVVQVHAEAQSDDGSLQQVAGELFCALVEGMGEGKAEDQPQSEGHRRRDKSAGGNREAQEKDGFRRSC